MKIAWSLFVLCRWLFLGRGLFSLHFHGFWLPFTRYDLVFLHLRFSGRCLLLFFFSGGWLFLPGLSLRVNRLLFMHFFMLDDLLCRSHFLVDFDLLVHLLVHVFVYFVLLGLLVEFFLRDFVLFMDLIVLIDLLLVLDRRQPCARMSDLFLLQQLILLHKLLSLHHELFDRQVLHFQLILRTRILLLVSLGVSSAAHAPRARHSVHDLDVFG